MKLEMPKSIYLRFFELLPELHPEIKIHLISCDEMLQELGFCDDAPCVVKFDFTNTDYEELLDELMQLEINAYNTHNGENPKPSDPDYQKYLRYGWMWNWLNNAKE